MLAPANCHRLTFLDRLILAGLAAGTTLAGAEPLAEDPWARIARFEFNAVADQSPAGLQGREERLAHAIALLNRQPRTEATVEGAAAALTALAAEHAGDDAGLWARYFSARIEQLHRTPANPVAAARQFRELAEAHPVSDAGQRAAVKLALLLVHEPAVQPDREAGFSEAVRIVGGLRGDAARAEGWLMLARAGVFFRRPATEVAAQFEAALAAGIANPPLRASALYALGDLARGLGRRELALRCFRQFVAENARDSRTNLVREWLAELEPVAAR